MTAHIKVPPYYDLPMIAAAAGQPDMNMRWYDTGVLFVDGVPQSDLDSSVAEYDHSEVERRRMRQRIAATRYDHEVSGTTFTHSDGNTYGIATDRQSQALTTGAAVQARRAQEAGNGDWSKRWKTARGFVTMTADDILAMGDAVDAHVQACFDREADLLAMVADGTITEDEIEKGWP